MRLLYIYAFIIYLCFHIYMFAFRHDVVRVAISNPMTFVLMLVDRGGHFARKQEIHKVLKQ